MKTIEQDFCANFEVRDYPKYEEDLLILIQCRDQFLLDKQGAKQLIEVLKEWVGDE